MVIVILARFNDFFFHSGVCNCQRHFSSFLFLNVNVVLRVCGFSFSFRLVYKIVNFSSVLSANLWDNLWKTFTLKPHSLHSEMAVGIERDMFMLRIIDGLWVNQHRTHISRTGSGYGSESLALSLTRWLCLSSSAMKPAQDLFMCV